MKTERTQADPIVASNAEAELARRAALSAPDNDEPPESPESVLAEAAQAWLDELHQWVIPGASCDEEREAFEEQADRIEAALLATTLASVPLHPFRLDTDTAGTVCRRCEDEHPSDRPCPADRLGRHAWDEVEPCQDCGLTFHAELPGNRKAHVQAALEAPGLSPRERRVLLASLDEDPQEEPDGLTLVAGQLYDADTGDLVDDEPEVCINDHEIPAGTRPEAPCPECVRRERS